MTMETETNETELEQEVKPEQVYQDKTLVCCDCNTQFVFSAGEQEWFSKKGFTNEPKRCPNCRERRRRRYNRQ